MQAASRGFVVQHPLCIMHPALTVGREGVKAGTDSTSQTAATVLAAYKGSVEILAILAVGVNYL